MQDGTGSDTDALLLAAGRGEVDALGAFYDSTAPTVFGLLQRVIGDPEQVARATERVYLRLWSSAPRFDPDDRSADALVLHVARREIAGWLSDAPASIPRCAPERPGSTGDSGSPPTHGRVR